MTKQDRLPKQRDPESVGLPPKFFLYTLDQIAEMVAVPVVQLRSRYVHFDRYSVGPHRREKMLARNIGMLGDPPEWRVTEAELVRWMKFKRFRFNQRGWLQD